MWRVIAALSNNLSKRSGRPVWASSPFQGSAGRAQGENNCNDFRHDFPPLDTSYAASCNKCRSAYEKWHRNCVLYDFVMILRVSGASRRQLRRCCQTTHQNISGRSSLWEVFLDHVGSQSWLLYILVGDLSYVFFGIAFGKPAALLFWGIPVSLWDEHFAYFMAAKMHQVLAKCTILGVLGR